MSNFQVIIYCPQVLLFGNVPEESSYSDHTCNVDVQEWVCRNKHTSGELRCYAHCLVWDDTLLRSSRQVASNQILVGQDRWKNLPSRWVRQNPLSRKDFFLLFPTATSSSQSWTIEGLFRLIRPPSWALSSPCALLPELWRNKDTVRCVKPGEEDPWHRQQQLMQTFNFFLKMHFFHSSKKGRARPPFPAL